MRTVLVSQRVEVIKSYGERRDCLDQNWCRFLGECGCLPVPVMNRGEDLEALAEAVKPGGILLTGGNDLSSYGGDAPERDETERRLIRLGLEREIPVLGVCRGFQMVTDYFGGKLERVTGHVACRHRILGAFEREVNSFHNMAALEVPGELEVLARTADGVAEAVRHREHKILAVMWHPEREAPFRREDIELVTDFFNKAE